MVGWKVAIFGTGRLAALLAARIPATCRKLIIGRRRGEAAPLADEVGGIAADSASAVRGCRVVFLTVPGPEVTGAIQALEPHLGEESLLVNMAQGQESTVLQEAFPELRIVGAKLIGHPLEVEAGTPGAILTDAAGPGDQELLQALLSGLGPVIPASEAAVREVQTAVAEAVVRAEQELRTRLAGHHPEAVRAAVLTLAPGVMRSLYNEETGAYLWNLVRSARAALSPDEAPPA